MTRTRRRGGAVRSTWPLGRGDPSRGREGPWAGSLRAACPPGACPRARAPPAPPRVQRRRRRRCCSCCRSQSGSGDSEHAGKRPPPAPRASRSASRRGAAAARAFAAPMRRSPSLTAPRPRSSSQARAPPGWVGRFQRRSHRCARAAQALPAACRHGAWCWSSMTSVRRAVWAVLAPGLRGDPKSGETLARFMAVPPAARAWARMGAAALTNSPNHVRPGVAHSAEPPGAACDVHTGACSLSRPTYLDAAARLPRPRVPWPRRRAPRRFGACLAPPRARRAVGARLAPRLRLCCVACGTDASSPRWPLASQLGCTVVTAAHGLEGVAAYRRSADELLCVLMDLQVRHSNLL